MLPWIAIAETTTPDGEVLRLFRRGTEYSIRLAGGNELMSSRVSGSEAALATLTAAALGGRDAPRLLIGGLGLGFTLRAAQSAFGPEARIEVAEIVPDLVDWAAGHLAPVFGDCLADMRVEVSIRDVAAIIAEADRAYDAILLDVDNGPDGLTRAGNNALYGAGGLGLAGRALRPGGILAIWSAHPDAAFERRLRAAGFAVRRETVRAGGGKRGPRHTIWLARRDG